MKITELTKYLQDKLKLKLNPFGFKKDGYGFTLNENGFTIKISFSSLNYDNSFPTSFSVWSGFLGIDRIILVATSKEQDLKKLKYGGQLFIRQADLFVSNKYPCKDYDIYTYEDADLAIDEILNYFLNTLIPHFKKFNSIEKLEHEINSNEFIENSKQLSMVIKYGLILARLVNNPDYLILRQKYRELIKDWSDWDKQELELVIAFIENHSQDELFNISQTSSQNPPVQCPNPRG